MGKKKTTRTTQRRTSQARAGKKTTKRRAHRGPTEAELKKNISESDRRLEGRSYYKNKDGTCDTLKMDGKKRNWTLSGKCPKKGRTK
jgi:hypothetical protein